MSVKPRFIISKMQSEFLSLGLRHATVKIITPTDAESGILDHVTLDITVEVSASITPEGLNDAIIAATVSRLAAILKCFENRKAKDFFEGLAGEDFPLPKLRR